jgi:hypothetical protein
MKKLFFSLLLLSSTAMYAQNDRDVPPPVRQSFQRDYGDVRDTRWEQTNGQWHAHYRDNNNRDVDAYYDRDGNRRDTHIAWDRRDVPQNVDNRINRRYHVNGEYRVQRIERPLFPPLFQIRIQRGTRDRTIYMDEQARRRRYHDEH